MLHGATLATEQIEQMTSPYGSALIKRNDCVSAGQRCNPLPFRLAVEGEINPMLQLGDSITGISTSRALNASNFSSVAGLRRR